MIFNYGVRGVVYNWLVYKLFI